MRHSNIAHQFPYSHLKSPDFERNSRKSTKGDHCILCGKPEPKPKFMVWEHCGGGTLVTLEEGERLNSSGESAGDLGYQPIGADCLSRHPELKPYVWAKLIRSP